MYVCMYVCGKAGMYEYLRVSHCQWLFIDSSSMVNSNSMFVHVRSGVG